jgi:co-chaperonin GroES (HSP10)
LKEVSKLDRNTNKDQYKDPVNFPQPRGVHVVVRPVEIDEKTSGGVYLPQSQTEDWTRLTSVGRVLAISNVAYDEDIHKEPWYEVGDFVLWSKMAGHKYRVRNEDGEEILLSYIPYEQVIAKVVDLDVLNLGSYKILEA